MWVTQSGLKTQALSWAQQPPNFLAVPPDGGIPAEHILAEWFIPTACGFPVPHFLQAPQVYGSISCLLSLQKELDSLKRDIAIKPGRQDK